MKKLALILAAGALVAGAHQVEAVQISGSIGLTGTFTTDNNILKDATSITITAAEVDVAFGDFDTFVNPGDAVTMASPILVGAVGPNPIPAGPIYNVGGFTLNLTEFALLFENNNQLNLGGVGIISHAGFEDTLGDFQLNFTRSGSGVTASLTFSATSAAELPDGGATAALLGVGILGLAGLRRKLS